MTHPWRASALADRHRALGSELEDWNGMGTAWTYTASSLADDHEAIRTRAGLMDVSGLKKVHYVGPHAEPLLQRAVTRDVRLLYPGKAVYATMLSDAGRFIDDCIVYRTGPNAWFVVHGAGAGHELLTAEAGGRQVGVLFDDDLHDLSLQGPLAVEFLARHVPGVRELATSITPPRRCSAARSCSPAPATPASAATRSSARLKMPPRSGTRSSTEGCRPRDRAVRVHGARLAAGRELPVLLPVRQLRDVPVRRRASRRHPVGARARLHRDGRQDRLPRRRGARPPAGHERFKIFGVLLEGDQAAAEGDTLLSPDGPSRRHHLRDVFAPDQPLDGHRAARRGGGRTRDSTRVAAASKPARSPHTLPFDDPAEDEADRR